MANQLIPIEQAAREIAAVINDSVAQLRAEGVSDERIAWALTEFFGRMGGFPPAPQEKGRK